MMFPKVNKLRQALGSDQASNGLVVQMDSPEIVELAGVAGYDFVVIDCEHGSIDYAAAKDMIRAADSVDIVPIVRVLNHDGAMIGKFLEAGAMGVMVPNVSTVAQMKSVVASTRFLAPGTEGQRGACPGVRSAGHQASNWREYVEWSNANVVVIPLIETPEGLQNFDELVRVPGIDAIGIGLFDLSHALGHHGSRDRPELDAIYAECTRKLRAAGVPFCRQILPPSQPYNPADATRSPAAYRADREHWMEQGARVFVAGSDRALLSETLRFRLSLMKGMQAP